METRLELEDGTELPLSENVAISLNYAIADIREPEKRDASHSKTISIPGSKQADKFFKSAFNIDGYGNYNVNLKKGCKIYTAGNIQLDGYIQLLNITILDKLVTYNCNIKGNVSNPFQLWGDALLRTLDVSDLDHDYTDANIEASWTPTLGTGYVYPMIDTGYTNGTYYTVEMFSPAIFLKEYIDRAFDSIGYTVSSTFFDTTLFKSLIIPYGGKRFVLSEAQVNIRLFQANRNTVQVVPFPTSSSTEITVEYNTIVNDPASQYNTTLWKWTVGVKGYYNIHARIRHSLAGPPAAFAPTGWIIINRYPFVGTPYMVTSNTLGVLNETIKTSDVNAGNILLEAGDVIQVKIRLDKNGATQPDFRVEDGHFKNTVVNSGLIEGDPVDISQSIPDKIKIKELITSVIKMFNLYIEVDKDNEKKVYIEPRDNFYINGATRDWTEKLIVEKDLVITPMGELGALRYGYNYKEDKDYYNTIYKNEHGEIYGNTFIDVTNDFVKGERKTEIIFSPTPLVQIGTTDRVVSQIIGIDAAGNIAQLPAFNVRILYWGGLVNTNYPWDFVSDASGSASKASYPYAGHLDSVANPTFDLNFGVPKEVFYIATSYTSKNLYNKYHSKYITEITHPDSKVVTGYFNLSPADIALLDFRDRFYVNGDYLRLNKIFDYNPTTGEPTKCEFMLIKDTPAFVGQDMVSDGGHDVLFNDGSTYPSSKPRPIPSGPKEDQTKINYIDPTAVKSSVSGESNHVGYKCFGITMTGCTRCAVLSEITNVTLVNCTDLVIDESNVTYIGNTKQSTVGVGRYEVNLSQTSTSAPSLQHEYINTLGTPTLNYSSVGIYTIIFPSVVFPDSKKVSIRVGNVLYGDDVRAFTTSTSRIEINTYSSATLRNGVLNNTTITVIVSE